MGADTFLNDTWSFYFHDPYNNDWTYGSYKKVCDVHNVNDYWNIENAMQDSIAKGMFFIMREHVFPCWDDANNITGGCISIKVHKQDMVEFWNQMCAHLLGETLLKPENMHLWDKINGLSTSPKKQFSIVKIWVGDPELANHELFDIPKMYHGEIIYKSNRDNISNDHASAAAQAQAVV
jgi:hypothetical protein